MTVNPSGGNPIRWVAIEPPTRTESPLKAIPEEMFCNESFDDEKHEIDKDGFKKPLPPKRKDEK